MRSPRIILTLLLLLSGLAVLPAHAQLREAEQLLERWEPEAAEARLRAALARDPKDLHLLALQARAAFYRGAYAEAVKRLDEALALPGATDELKELRLFIEQTHEVTRGYATYESPHFALRLDARRDGILASFALEALEATHQVVSRDLGFAQTPKVRVEIVPDSQSFQAVSSLTVRDIEQAGAVGIAKFNKLMLISPRALVHGYRWLDSLVHEYLHYAIVKLSGNRAPIWVHEGIAKHEEARWRTPGSLYLSPSNQSLLAQAGRENRFVPFEKMDPAIIRLETPFEIHLAYAQSASAVDFLVSRAGYVGLRAFLQAMPEFERQPARGALQKVFGLTFGEFERQWEAFLRAKGLQEVPGVSIPQYKVRGQRTDDERLELEEIKDAIARNRTRLADLFRERGRLGAAVLEYRRALRESPQSVVILTKLARTHIAMDRPQEALPLLQQARQIDPDRASIHSVLGTVLLRLGDLPAARRALEEAVQINPFDPRVHQELGQVYDRLGEPARAQQARERFKLLGAR